METENLFFTGFDRPPSKNFILIEIFRAYNLLGQTILVKLTRSGQIINQTFRSLTPRMNVLRWPRAAPLTFIFAVLTIVTAINSRFHFIQNKKIFDFKIRTRIWKPWRVESDKLVRIFTSPFSASGIANTFLVVVGLYIFGADFEFALSPKRFRTCLALIFAGLFLLSGLSRLFGLEFKMWDPFYLPISLAVCYALFSQDNHFQILLLGCLYPTTHMLESFARDWKQILFAAGIGYVVARLMNLTPPPRVVKKRKVTD
jgi:membrane associated rhomboid family serine protease